ncbi:signal peptide-containing protein [Theileria equi strain WA]|uniref:Signal peptide-containing protein n=1 Tax=Theileria equi strain WA TaxID=1537102 RepID=L0AWK5_THEEQ|nr:signal peptide-containing protein [Theileria equi strain WA]AFZ79920.1 signal peptide-containing protein [Theileria equi strain WA]|eukprot:XP_004829586.1 signal peptide-containing protein [Theileria equi strain WA]
MRILAVLWTVSLVGLCHGVGYFSKCLRSDTTLDILDFSKPDPSICRAVETNVGGIPAVVYLLKSKKVNKIVNGDEGVWKGTYEDKCFYCIAFLKDNEPHIVVIGAKSPVRKSLECYKYKDKTGCCGRGGPGWSSTSSYIKEVNALKVGSNASANFTLDLSSLEEDGERFKLVKEEKNGVTTLFFSTKPGHLIERIVDGNLEVWTASDNQVCYLCEYYPKSASGKVKLHVRKNKDSFSFTSFEKTDGEWKKK